MYDKTICMHNQCKVRMNMVPKLIDHFVVEHVDIGKLVCVTVAYRFRQSKRFPVCNKDGIAKFDSTHAVFHCLNGSPHVDTRHRHQRHIGQL